MQAGLLRDIIEVERAQSVADTKTGEQSLTWARVWRGRARVEYSNGSQLMENNETINTITRKVTIRTKPLLSGPLSLLRVKIGASLYRILSMDVRNTDMATIMIVELINE